MADIKDTIDNVERCLCHIQDACMLCPHIEGDATEDCMENLMRDALEAMKSQQAEIERLKAQKQKWLRNIADQQLTVSPTGYETEEELAKRTGEWNGLQMAWEILTKE